MKVIKVNCYDDHKSITAVVIDCIGWFCFLFNGLRHRSNGPAEISNDCKLKLWFKYGNLHREDGPAVIREKGYKEWFLNDKKYYNGPYTRTEWRRIASLQVFK